MSDLMIGAVAEFSFRGLPEPKFSLELNAALLKIIQSKVAAYDAALLEWEQMPQTEAWLERHNQSLDSRPIRVLTTGNHAVHFLPAPNAQDLSISNTSIRSSWRRRA
jgi:hypothetical protein